MVTQSDIITFGCTVLALGFLIGVGTVLIIQMVAPHIHFS